MADVTDKDREVEVPPCTPADVEAARRAIELMAVADRMIPDAADRMVGYEATIAYEVAQAREEGRREERERVSRMFVDRTPGGWPDDDADVPDGWASWILLLHDNEAGDLLDSEEAAAHFLRNMQPAIRARGAATHSAADAASEV